MTLLAAAAAQIVGTTTTTTSAGTITTTTTSAGTTTTTTTVGDFATLGTGKSLDLSGTVNLVVDGNSIMTSAYSSVGAFDASLRLYAPLSGVDTSTSVAISGQRWENMTADHSDLDAAWVDGVTNLLILGETRNQIVIDWNNGINTQAALVASCKAAIEAYLPAIRAVHPGWKIIMLGTLPSGGDSVYSRYAIENAAFSEVDAWLHTQVDTLDLYAMVSFRNHAAFDHDGTASQPFEDYQPLWFEGSPRYTHPRDAGKALMAQNVNAAVSDLAVP